MKTELNAPEWDQFLSQYPNAHILQTSTWGELKSVFGWDATRLVVGTSGVQILFRRIPLGYHIAYIAKGPVGDDWEAILPAIDSLCRSRRSIFLKVEPDIWEKGSDSDKEQTPPGFYMSSHSIQPPRTLVVDLRGDEGAILGRMKQKTRYNVRLALKRGIIVRPTADIQLFYDIVRVTSERDQFGVHSLAYYQKCYDIFHPRGECELFIAEYDGQPLAGLMVFAHGGRAWYFYGASSNQFRELMPTYLLQWEAMRWAKNQGCEEYDLWGVPDADIDDLEENFTSRSDGLWGVYRFKRGFGGKLQRAMGPWDRVYMPTIYKLYTMWMDRTEV
jgi:peptidoglycan pentaglycine glycine transferase (the first glycine)